jgi:hypothetical protein
MAQRHNSSALTGLPVRPAWHVSRRDVKRNSVDVANLRIGVGFCWLGLTVSYDIQSIHKKKWCGFKS